SACFSDGAENSRHRVASESHLAAELVADPGDIAGRAGEALDVPAVHLHSLQPALRGDEEDGRQLFGADLDVHAGDAVVDLFPARLPAGPGAGEEGRGEPER